MYKSRSATVNKGKAGEKVVDTLMNEMAEQGYTYVGQFVVGSGGGYADVMFLFYKADKPENDFRDYHLDEL